jgi:signal transduction histidine kinase
MLPVELLSAVLASLGNIFLGLFTLRKNPRSATGKLFFSFTFVLALYIGANFLATHQTTDEGAGLWVRGVMTLALAINVLFYLLVDTFPEGKIRTHRFVLWASLLTTLMLVPITVTNLIFQSVTIDHGAVKQVPGLGMPAFLLHTLVFLGGGFMRLIQRFRSSRGIEKTQIRFFLAGTVFMFVSLLVTNLVFVVLFNNSALVGLLPLYTLVFVGCISYAIIRHRFLDINLLVVRAVMYTLLLVFVAVTFSLGVSFLGRVFLQVHFTQQEQWVLIGITILITALYQWVRQLLERLTDRIFFQGRYDTHDVLNALSHVMASTLRLEDVTHGLLDIVLRELRITKGAFILVHDDLVTDVLSQGFKPFPTLAEEDVKILLATRETLDSEEVTDKTVKDVLQRLDASLVVHLRTEGTQIGLLILGPKSSGDIFSGQDLSLFEIFAPEAAVAIQNALAYEEIRRFTVTLQDEVARSTEDLRKANVRLQDLDKLKDEFVSLASHELRTPLTAIRSYLWIALSGKGGPLSEKLQYYINRSYLSTERLIKLVNDMLNISRIESGRMAVQFVRTDPRKLIDDVIADVRPRFDEQGIHLSEQYPDAIPDVIADVDKIKEVLVNFFSNSIKFTPRGGTISVRVESQDGSVRISVSDTGIGFLKGEADKLFKKFGTLASTSSSNQAFQSTGLGLYISKSIVGMHGGTISASSEGVGKGATFWFTLPVYTPAKREDLQRRFAYDGLGIIHNATV